MPYSFLLVGGGTGGHVFPALAVARVLKERSHKILYAGTSDGIEARLVSEAGFDFAPIRSGALNRVGLKQQARTSLALPANVASAARVLRKFGAQAVFSMGGYVAGPVILAALLARIPLVVMEPNAVPGIANRWVSKRVYRALVGFAETAAWFPKGRTEMTGLPVRDEFFHVPPKRASDICTLLITGGSRGARTLNRAARESWKLFQESGGRVRILHQAGAADADTLARDFAQTGLTGEVLPFLKNMAEAFAEADLVVARAGAGSVNELAAAGMPSILVPFPFAAGDHQKKNAEAMARGGAARMILDAEMTGERLFAEVQNLWKNPDRLLAMREHARRLAHPGAAQRAAEVLEEAARSKN